MSHDRDLLGSDDDRTRAELRDELVEVVRSLGRLFPQSEKEIDTFDETHGPYTPLAEDEVASLRDAALARLSGKAPSAPISQDWSWLEDPSAMPLTGALRGRNLSDEDAPVDAPVEQTESKRRRNRRGRRRKK